MNRKDDEKVLGARPGEVCTRAGKKLMGVVEEYSASAIG
jgi:hypothetical protein